MANVPHLRAHARKLIFRSKRRERGTLTMQSDTAKTSTRKGWRATQENTQGDCDRGRSKEGYAKDQLWDKMK